MPLSQVGRVLAARRIEHIFAQSPQAKGRAERLFGPLPDRLVKHLRRQQACTLEQANQALPAYLAYHNQRFAKQPACTESVCQPWIASLLPGRVSAFICERVAVNDNTITYGNIRLPIPPGAYRRSYVQARVVVSLHFNGDLQVCYQNELIAPFAHSRAVQVRVDHFVLAEPIIFPSTVVKQSAPDPAKRRDRQPMRPRPDHPWRAPL